MSFPAEAALPSRPTLADRARELLAPLRALSRAGEAEGTRACRLALAGYLLGCFLLPSDGLRVLWLAVSMPLACLCIRWPPRWPEVKRDSVRLWALHFLCWMTVRSLLGYGMVDGASGMVAAGWLLGTALLAAFAALVWYAARNPQELESLGRWVGLAAAGAAGVSFVLFYILLPDHSFGERLMNAFPYGGLNPVSTGLTFGFAALWLACLLERGGTQRDRMLMTCALAVLLVAVCFTRSRGALLALLTGNVVFTATRGLRRTWLQWGLFVGAFALFAASGPLVERVAAWQIQSRTPDSEVMTVQPVTEMVHRGDAGRFELYSRALQALTGPERWLLGIGQWGPEEACCRSLSRLQYHLHSSFLATLVHGGLIGCALLLVLLGLGTRRALSLARRGQDLWLVLLSYGCTGLLFDGQTFTSLTSIPQIETLIFAFPLVAAAAVWRHQTQPQEAEE